MAPALRGRDLLFFLCLWCFYRLYLSLLRDLWDLTKDKLCANRAGVPLNFQAIPSANWFAQEKKIDLIFLWQNLQYCSSQHPVEWSVMCSAQLGHDCLSQTRAHFSGRLIIKSLLFLIPGRMKPFYGHYKSRRITKKIIIPLNRNKEKKSNLCLTKGHWPAAIQFIIRFLVA